MRKTPIILDRLDAALKLQGVALKRSRLLEAAAAAFGYRSSNEFAAADADGGLDAAPAVPVGAGTIAGVPLIALRDGSGAVYAVEASFLEAADGMRRETFGPSPYGGLVDLSGAAGHPLTVWDAADAQASTGASTGVTEPCNDLQSPSAGRYAAFDGEDVPILRSDDLAEARAACRTGGTEGRDDLDAYVVDVAAMTISRARTGWTVQALPPVAGCGDAAAWTAAELHLSRLRREELELRVHNLTVMGPDWTAWEKDLKKASRRHQEPIDDEQLHRFRHAVADNHCKSSDSERSTVRHREAAFVSQHLGGLLARLDRAEAGLAEAGLSPADVKRIPAGEASALLAAVETAAAGMAGEEMPGLYEVDAVRDGERYRRIYRVGPHELHEDAGRRLAAEAFRMDLEEFADQDGEYWDFDSECDAFEIRAVERPAALAAIGEALGLLASGGLSYTDPARVKLLAAADLLRPKPDAPDTPEA